MPGDLWADVYLVIDKSGYAIRCYIGKSNISGEETRSNVCRNYVSGWRTEPSAGAGPRVTTIKRFFLWTGYRHLDKQTKQARKRYFDDHPEQRPECWDD
jgi:hypothetical protein